MATGYYSDRLSTENHPTSRQLSSAQPVAGSRKSSQTYYLRAFPLGLASEVQLSTPERQINVNNFSKFTQEQLESGVTPEQLAARMRLAGIKEGERGQILGENIHDLANDIYTDVSQLFAGADIATVLEERGHGDFKKALVYGRVTTEQAIEAANIWAKVTGETGFAITEDMSQETRDTILHEAVADMIQAKFFGNARKLEQMGKLPSGIRAFISRMVEYFRDILRRAAALKKAEADGKFTEDWQNFLAESVGLRDAVEVSRKAEQELIAIDPGLVPFSMRRGDPQRNSKKVFPIKIDEKVLIGNRSELRRIVRDYISAHLQGKSILNKDSGFPIKFSSVSKSESVNKLRREEAFRTALQLEKIVEDAIMYKDSPPSEKHALDTERSYNFAIPVEFDLGEGKQKVWKIAWFNANKQLRGEDVVFYQFGLKKNTVQASPGLGTDKQSNTPILKPHFTVAQIMEEVNQEFSIKTDSEINYSMAPGNYVERMRAMVDSVPKRPVEWLEVYNRARQKLAQLKERFPEHGQPKQTFKEIDERRKVREEEIYDAKIQANAGTFEALENAEVLSNLKEQPVVAALLNNVGKLRSKTEERKQNGNRNIGLYDDAPYLPSYFWGGVSLGTEPKQNPESVPLGTEP